MIPGDGVLVKHCLKETMAKHDVWIPSIGVAYLHILVRNSKEILYNNVAWLLMLQSELNVRVKFIKYFFQK